MENMQKPFSKKDLFLCICCYYLYLEIYVLFQNKETWLIPFNHHFVQARSGQLRRPRLAKMRQHKLVIERNQSFLYVLKNTHPSRHKKCCLVYYIYIYIYIPAFSMVFGELYKCTIHTYCAWFICIISFTLIHSHIIRTIIYVQGVKSARYKCCYYMNYFSVYTTF